MDEIITVHLNTPEHIRQGKGWVVDADDRIWRNWRHQSIFCDIYATTYILDMNVMRFTTWKTRLRGMWYLKILLEGKKSAPTMPQTQLLNGKISRARCSIYQSHVVGLPVLVACYFPSSDSHTRSLAIWCIVESVINTEVGIFATPVSHPGRGTCRGHQVLPDREHPEKMLDRSKGSTYGILRFLSRGCWLRRHYKFKLANTGIYMKANKNKIIHDQYFQFLNQIVAPSMPRKRLF